MRNELYEYLQVLACKTYNAGDQLQAILFLIDELTKTAHTMRLLDEMQENEERFHRIQVAYEQLWRSLEEVLACNEEMRQRLSISLAAYAEMSSCPFDYIKETAKEEANSKEKETQQKLQHPLPQATIPLEADTSISPVTQPTLQKVQFSAVAPEQLQAKRYGMVDIVMYEEAFRAEVDALLAKAKQPMQETKTGKYKVDEGTKVTIHLQVAEGDWYNEIQTQIWQGDYLTFRFAVRLPEAFTSTEALFTASVYLNDVIATTLTFVVQCDAAQPQRLQPTRQDIYSGFVSYASQDRAHVAMLVQGMKKARPDLDLFFDVETLRSGENWQEALYREIDRHDTLFLCWSNHAKQSEWVNREWRYTLKQKGKQAIEPIPLEPSNCCPPPVELDSKHFNDIMLYIIHSPW